jgi:hypothetical protein
LKTDYSGRLYLPRAKNNFHCRKRRRERLYLAKNLLPVGTPPIPKA